MKVGYIMGSGDQVPDAIRRMGLAVSRSWTTRRWAPADLSAFDTIVVGIRASEARPDFVANNGRLLDYVRNGGTLVVQYQQADFAARNLAPFPVQIGLARDRRDRPREDPRAGPPGVHDAEPDHERRLRRLGAGAEPVRVHDVRPAVHSRCSRRPIPASRRRRAGRSTRRSARASTSTRRTRGSGSCRPACLAPTGSSRTW